MRLNHRNHSEHWPDSLFSEHPGFLGAQVLDSYRNVNKSNCLKQPFSRHIQWMKHPLDSEFFQSTVGLIKKRQIKVFIYLFKTLQSKVCYRLHHTKIFDEYLTLFWPFRKAPNIKMGKDIVSDMWQEENLDLFLVHLLFSTQSKKCKKSFKNLGLVETIVLRTVKSQTNKLKIPLLFFAHVSEEKPTLSVDSFLFSPVF